MSENNNKKYHRGRRRKKTFGSIFSTILLIVAVCVMIFSGFQLFKILKGYHDGRSEYKDIEEISITQDEEDDRYRVDFDALWEINPDVVGWIRFDEPAVISYPLVQGKDNSEYLNRTFKGFPNTVGSIFLDVNNRSDFSDRNTLIYGHYMRNGTMFNELDQYREEEFWKKYPCFYIYTPDGKESKYHIYSVAEVVAGEMSHRSAFADDADFENFLEETKNVSFYDTGVELDKDSKVVTLSTCTRASDEHRLVVHGVKVEERD